MLHTQHLYTYIEMVTLTLQICVHVPKLSTFTTFGLNSTSQQVPAVYNALAIVTTVHLLLAQVTNPNTYKMNQPFGGSI